MVFVSCTITKRWALFGCMAWLKSPPRSTKRTPEVRQAENHEKGFPRNSNTSWIETLKTDLAEQFNEAISPNELAVRFERTYGSIVAQLKQQGLIGGE
jgi:hypothetical protein